MFNKEEKKPGYVKSEPSPVKEILDKEEKVTIKIMAKKNNETPVPVTINGYRCIIKRGEKVEVPKSIADILEQGGYT